MSSPRHSNIARLSQPSPHTAGSDPSDRLRGLDNLLVQAMDLMKDEDLGPRKLDYNVDMDDTEKLLDFEDIMSISKSCVKESTTFEKDDVPLETAEEFVLDKPVLVTNKTPGTSDVSSLVSSNDGGNKKYKLFVLPGMIECVELCKTSLVRALLSA